jgi:hypothetical protein
MHANLEPILALSLPTPKKPTQPPNYSIPDLFSTNLATEEAAAIIAPDLINFTDNQDDWARINTHNEALTDLLDDYNRTIQELRGRGTSSSSNTTTSTTSSCSSSSSSAAAAASVSAITKKGVADKARAQALISQSLR